jgi:hypothetical protein
VKTTLGHVVVVALLLAAGEGFRRTATFEDALSSAEEHLTTQSPAETLPEEGDDRVAPLGASLPLVGPAIRADLRRQRALAAYWRADYQALQTPDPDGQAADGATRFIAASAMFRNLARQQANSQVLVRGLDAVLKAYVSVLEVDPNDVDAAYNYEFVSRLRGALAAGRTNSIKLPSEPHIQGEKGSPPIQTKPTEFNIIVPLRPEERQEQIQPGANAVPQRKG